MGAGERPEAGEVCTLRAGEAVDAVFACTRKDRQIARTGAPYLTVELRDGTGSVLGRIFKDADLYGGRFDRGDLVRVVGQAVSFNDRLQIEIASIERSQAPEDQLERFLPASRRDLDELEGFLEHLVREIYDPGLRAVCERALGDRTLAAELRRAPCAIPGEGGRGRHHAYLGGLLEHTVAVASLAVDLCQVHPRLDRDLLVCAAVLHDIGRTQEFSYGAEIQRTDLGRMVGHIELGLRLIGRHAPSSLDPSRRLALEHCVFMHHGPREGSELRFASPEAVALHRLNALDSNVKGFLEMGVK